MVSGRGARLIRDRWVPFLRTEIRVGQMGSPAFTGPHVRPGTVWGGVASNPAHVPGKSKKLRYLLCATPGKGKL